MTVRSRIGRHLLLLLTALTFFLAASAGRTAPAAPVTVQVDGRTIPFIVTPFIGDDGVVYAPVDLILPLGGAYSPDGDSTVRVTSANGAARALAFRTVSSRLCVSVPDLVAAAGLHGSWDSARRVYSISTHPDVVASDPSAQAAPAPLTVTGIAVAAVSDAITRITVTASGASRYRTVTLDGPDRLAFDLEGVDIAANLGGAAVDDNPLIRAIRTGRLPGAAGAIGRIVFDLAHPARATVRQEPSDDGSVTYIIDLQADTRSQPAPSALPVLSNALRGKVVMIDPGHGGSDTGALGVDGTTEKSLTLLIGRQVRDVLQQNGARVYLTRNDDTLPSVHARPEMAVAANADYFISIHCDSSGGVDSHTGSTVYFHMHDPVCRRMAECIINRIAAVSGIPSNGVRSDTVRFQTGFGVLRGSPMPAVLVECGYMNNHGDLRKLRSGAVQQAIAHAIVAGLIDFDTEMGSR